MQPGAHAARPDRSRRLLGFGLGCGCVLLAGCVGCAVAVWVWPSEELGLERGPAVTGVTASDARSAMLGTWEGTYDARGSVAGIAAEQYHDRGTITVSAGDGGELVFTSVTRQTGDTCVVAAAWDGEVARVRPNQRCEGEFNDGTTYTGTIEDGVARLSGATLIIETRGRIWGRRGFFPYTGDYTGEWRCTRVP